MLCEIKGIFEIVKRKNLNYKILSPAVEYIRPPLVRFTNIEEFEFTRSGYLQRQYANGVEAKGAL